MAENNNAKCSICDKDYYLCLSCKDTLSLNPWRVHTCNAPHYQIYQIIRGYNTNMYTKDEARTRLKNVNLEDVESFRPHITNIIKDILKEEKSVVKPVEKIVETKIETVIESEVETEKNTVVEDVVKVEESENLVKTAYSRKRNYKVETE